jgi:hypothetical protein
LLLRRVWETRALQKSLIWMIRLEASRAILHRNTLSQARMIVFDQGPFYTLVRLQKAAQATEISPTFRHWWDAKLQLWADTLDVLVMLDAPDGVLVNPIDQRPKSHALKGRPHETARESLIRERALYEAVAAQIQSRSDVRVVRYDTSRESIDVIAVQIMGALPLPRSTESKTTSG